MNSSEVKKNGSNYERTVTDPETAADYLQMRGATFLGYFGDADKDEECDVKFRAPSGTIVIMPEKTFNLAKEVIKRNENNAQLAAISREAARVAADRLHAAEERNRQFNAIRTAKTAQKSAQKPESHHSFVLKVNKRAVLGIAAVSLLAVLALSNKPNNKPVVVTRTPGGPAQTDLANDYITPTSEYLQIAESTPTTEPTDIPTPTSVPTRAVKTSSRQKATGITATATPIPQQLVEVNAPDLNAPQSSGQEQSLAGSIFIVGSVAIGIGLALRSLKPKPSK